MQQMNVLSLQTYMAQQAVACVHQAALHRHGLRQLRPCPIVELGIGWLDLGWMNQATTSSL